MSHADLTKAERITAYKMVDEVLGRAIPAVVLKHHLQGLPPDAQELIQERAEYILRQLREDAKDLWDES